MSFKLSLSGHRMRQVLRAASRVSRCAASGVLACGSVLAWALPAPPFDAADRAYEIENCISPARMVMAAGQPRAVLEPRDQGPLRDEMMRRYPVVGHDGFAVSRIILWQPTRGDALFVTVLDHPSHAGAPCFTATFTAPRFDGFERLRDHYLRAD